MAAECASPQSGGVTPTAQAGRRAVPTVGREQGSSVPPRPSFHQAGGGRPSVRLYVRAQPLAGSSCFPCCEVYHALSRGLPDACSSRGSVFAPYAVGSVPLLRYLGADLVRFPKIGVGHQRYQLASRQCVETKLATKENLFECPDTFAESLNRLAKVLEVVCVVDELTKRIVTGVPHIWMLNHRR